MKKRLLKVACVLLVLLAGGWAFLAVTPFGIVLKQNPGRFSRGHFEAVVAQVRSMSLPVGEEVKLRLDDPSDPASLRLAKQGGMPFHYGEGNVWAELGAGGALKVVIETRDLGHAGHYGFAYSDDLVSPYPLGGDGDWLRIDVPGHINITLPSMRIDRHWWEVLNNLD